MISIAYCGTADIRAITNLTTSEISNAEIGALISHATYDINADVGATLFLKLSIDNFVGDFDGTNATFTCRNSPIGDLDHDGSVGTTDMEVWRKLASEDHWTKMSNPITTVDDHEFGKFTFASAPQTTYEYIIKYVWFPLPYNHNLMKKACTELTSYMCFLKVNLKDVSSYRIGKVSVSKTARHPDLVNFYDRYQATLGKIRGRTMVRPITWDMTNKMARELVENVSTA